MHKKALCKILVVVAKSRLLPGAIPPISHCREIASSRSLGTRNDSLYFRGFAKPSKSMFFQKKYFLDQK